MSYAGLGSRLAALAVDAVAVHLVYLVGVAMVGYKKGIGPGSHYVNVYINSAYAGCQLQERGLNVIVNFH